MATESQVATFVNDILKVESIEEAFNCFLMHKPESNSSRLQDLQDELKTLFTGIPADQHEAAVKQYVHLMGENRNPKVIVEKLLNLLQYAVNNNILPARLVCECLLQSERLCYTNGSFWIGTFKLVYKIIGGVDYKGVREIMKNCLEKAHTFPSQLNPCILPQLQVLVVLIEHIFDRNACLLPSYFIVNEILKAYPENKNWPHWKIANLLSTFVESFRATSAMVSIIGRSKMLPLVEHSGHPGHSVNPWKLEPTTLRYTLKGNLPYDKELFEPQKGLVNYILEQPYSRDMVCSMLGLQKQHKQRCAVLEDRLVDLIISAMEYSENEVPSTAPPPTSGEATEELLTESHWVWQHLSSQLIFFVLFQFASFPHMVAGVQEKLSGRTLRKGRDHLMWVLLQFISGSIQKNPLHDFLPVLNLYDLLYPEREPLIVPDYTKASCTHSMAATCIWIHIRKKAQTEANHIQRPLPHALKAHYDFLQHTVIPSNIPLTVDSDYRVALLCNAYSTNPDYFPRPMGTFVETIYGNQKTHTPMPGTNCMAAGPTLPLSMAILDSLTVHAKMSLIHNIVTHVIKQAQTKSTLALPPALVETYSRLLVYMEIESLGIKGFMSQLLPQVFKFHAWGILHTLLETFSYRLHHIQPHYRVQLLSHLHSLAAVPQTNQTQLHLCVESTALRLITGLGSAEVHPQLSRVLSESKTLVSAESEELNRALVLTLARAIQVTSSEIVLGTWYKDILSNIMQNTPHSWANHTLQCFPPTLAEFFQQTQVSKENKQQIKKSVEEEYRNWASMSNENDIITHFSLQGTHPLFLCLLWKMILETDRINPIAYKVLERIGARALSSHLRKFSEYLVFEFANSGGGQHVNKCIDAMNDMIWKYNIITIDRLILCLALRTQEGSEAQVCFFIIQLLLLKPFDFRNRVQEFVRDNSPEHWKQSKWHERHLAFHRKFPEKFAPEGMLEQSGGLNAQYQTMPVYFGNVCLRFLPVFDIVIHRYLEIPQVAKSLETLLEHLGCLYKFHDRPITYLYNSLHYYERRLTERPLLKRKLVQAIIGSLKEIRPNGWCLSEAYQLYTTRGPEDISWIPETEYYSKMVQRMVDTINGHPPFPTIDWRFNEFPNAASHALHVTCVELMALPIAPNLVGEALLNVIIKGYYLIPRTSLLSWINAIGIIIAALPETYWSVLNEHLVQTMDSPALLKWPYKNNPFQLFNFKLVHAAYLDCEFGYTLALSHSIWHHSSLGQIIGIPQLVKDRLRPLIKTEEQLLFLCHLVGPFLQRFYTERPRCVYDLTIELYELLEQVDKNSEQPLRYMDQVCDLLYHIKYMFTGDTVKAEVEHIIRNLRPALQKRLRFITHLNVDEIGSSNILAPAGTAPSLSSI